MSRSYRRPYAAVTGIPHSHDDKKVAARGMRRKQNQWLQTLDDFDQAIVAHRLECSFNNTYSWARDGRQFLHHPTSRYPNSVDRARVSIG